MKPSIKEGRKEGEVATELGKGLLLLVHFLEDSGELHLELLPLLLSPPV